METHVKIVGWLYILLGALGLLGAFVFFVLMVGIGFATDDRTAVGVLSVVGVSIAIIVTALSIPGIIAGLGLNFYQPWARVLALVLGVLNLPGFPLGTLIGVYTLYALLDEESARLFSPA